MKGKEEKKQRRLKIRVVFTAGAVGLFGAACPSLGGCVAASPCDDCEVTNLDGGHDGGVDAGPDAGKDGGLDGGLDGGDGG